MTTDPNDPLVGPPSKIPGAGPPQPDDGDETPTVSIKRSEQPQEKIPDANSIHVVGNTGNNSFVNLESPNFIENPLPDSDPNKDAPTAYTGPAGHKPTPGFRTVNEWLEEHHDSGDPDSKYVDLGASHQPQEDDAGILERGRRHRNPPNNPSGPAR